MRLCAALRSRQTALHLQLQVPSLSPSSPSRSLDLEEDRRRQEKWQEEQERLLQVKRCSLLLCFGRLEVGARRILVLCFFVVFFSHQAQYQRDQERLEAEWRRAQRDATGELRKEAEIPGAFLQEAVIITQMRKCA